MFSFSGDDGVKNPAPNLLQHTDKPTIPLSGAALRFATIFSDHNHSSSPPRSVSLTPVLYLKTPHRDHHAPAGGPPEKPCITTSPDITSLRHSSRHRCSFLFHPRALFLSRSHFPEHTQTHSRMSVEAHEPPITGRFSPATPPSEQPLEDHSRLPEVEPWKVERSIWSGSESWKVEHGNWSEIWSTERGMEAWSLVWKLVELIT